MFRERSFRNLQTGRFQCRPGLSRCAAVLPALAQAVCVWSWLVASGGGAHSGGPAF